MNRTGALLLTASLLSLAANLVEAQVNPAVTFQVNAATGHEIDPRIYGASWADADEIEQLGLTLNRWGGNAMSRYNWEFSTANRCKDYYFYNIPDPVSSGDGSNGKSADDFIGMSFDAGAAPIITVPMLSLLPRDRMKRCSYPGFPPQQELSPEGDGCGNGRNPDGSRVLGVADPAGIAEEYDATHQANWIEHLVATWGAASAGGVRYYSLDNEPSLWSADHWDVHPEGASYDEVWGKMSEYGAAIKGVDRDAILTGPDEWGWSGYFMSGLDQENYGTPDENEDRLAHGNTAYIDWLLQQARTYEEANGVRLLDVLSVHFYPQNGEPFSGQVDVDMQELRNRSTRALWDPNYVDESWIGETGIDGGIVQLIPRLKQWVADHYPGTETGITEYNWGDVNHINGATAQADVLGIFGREDLDIGVRWVSADETSFVGSAFRMYRNYDGAQSAFGDFSVPATGGNPDQVAIFAARRSSDDALTIMLIAKRLTGSTPVTVNVSGFTANGAVAERWQLGPANTIVQLADIAFNGSAVLSLPAQTVTLLVIPGMPLPELAAPSGFTATATSSSSVALHWTAVAGASQYEIQRSYNNSVFTTIATTASTSYADGGRGEDISYLYRVRAIQGASLSPYSIDVATTTMFEDGALAAGMPIRVPHVAQLRTAVNALRHAAGLAPFAFTDVLSTAIRVKAVHVTQLRTALDQARADLGLPAIVYTDPALVPGTTTAKAAHVTQLRNGVR